MKNYVEWRQKIGGCGNLFCPYNVNGIIIMIFSLFFDDVVCVVRYDNHENLCRINCQNVVDPVRTVEMLEIKQHATQSIYESTFEFFSRIPGVTLGRRKVTSTAGAWKVYVSDDVFAGAICLAERFMKRLLHTFEYGFLFVSPWCLQRFVSRVARLKCGLHSGAAR